MFSLKVSHYLVSGKLDLVSCKERKMLEKTKAQYFSFCIKRFTINRALRVNVKNEIKIGSVKAKKRLNGKN